MSPGIKLVEGLSPEALARAHVIFTGKVDFDPAATPQLHWIQLNTVAVNHILDKPVAKSGIPVATVSGAYSAAVAEFTIGVMLALTRRFSKIHSLQLNSRWPSDFAVVLGENCYGKTMGIVGYGSIGRHIARIADAMGMKVLAFKRRPKEHSSDHFHLPGTGDPDGTIPQEWFGVGQLPAMLQKSDVAVVTLSLTLHTRHMIGRRELEALPSHAYLINVGRGSVIDEAALAEHLQAGRIAGAALDVFGMQPLQPESPFWKLSNVIVSPHIGSYTREQSEMAAEVLIENLSRYLDGAPLVNVVDMEQEY